MSGMTMEGLEDQVNQLGGKVLELSESGNKILGLIKEGQRLDDEWQKLDNAKFEKIATWMDQAMDREMKSVELIKQQSFNAIDFQQRICVFLGIQPPVQPGE